MTGRDDAYTEQNREFVCCRLSQGSAQLAGAAWFTSKERDAETGLDFFGARYFSSAQGRFTSVDEPFLDQDPSDPQSWNLYGYVRNNPLRYIDSTGRACVGNGSGGFVDDNSGGQSCADVDKADQKRKAALTVRGNNDGSVQYLAISGQTNGFLPNQNEGLRDVSYRMLPAFAGGRGVLSAINYLRTLGDFIDPSKIRFSQDSIKATFKDGRSVADLAEELKNGTVKPNEIPAIRLVERDGELFTLDNRRLEAFKRAGVKVPYRMATPEEIANEAGKFTTKNGGTSIRVR